MKDNHKTAVLLVFVIIGLILVLIALTMVLLNPKGVLTGFSLNTQDKIEPSYDPYKYCFYEIDGKSFSFYNCNELKDCENQVKKLLKEPSLKQYNLENIKASDCV